VARVAALDFMAEGAEVSGEAVFVAAAVWGDEASPAAAIAAEALAEVHIAVAVSTAAHRAAAVMPAVDIAAAALAEVRIAVAVSTAAHRAAALMPAVAIAAHIAEGTVGLTAVTAIVVDMGSTTAVTATTLTARSIPVGTAVAADSVPLA